VIAKYEGNSKQFTIDMYTPIYIEGVMGVVATFIADKGLWEVNRLPDQLIRLGDWNADTLLTGINTFAKHYQD